MNEPIIHTLSKAVDKINGPETERPDAFQRPPCANMGEVEHQIQQVSKLRDEWADVVAHAEEQILKIRLWEERESQRIKDEIAWRQNSATTWFKREENNPGDKGSRKMVHGTLKRLKGQLKARIINPESIPRELCNHKPEAWAPDLNKIKARIKDSGGDLDAVPGAEGDFGETTYWIDTGHDKKFRGAVSVPWAEAAENGEPDYEVDETEGKPLHEWNGG